MITDSVENAGQRPETGNLGKEPVASELKYRMKRVSRRMPMGLLENPSRVMVYEA